MATTGHQSHVTHHTSRRVIFLDHTAALGGGEIALLNLVAHLDCRDKPIVVLFSDGPLVTRLAELGIETHLFPLSERITNTRKGNIGAGLLLRVGDVVSALGFVWRMRRFLRSLRADLVHTNSLKSDLLGGVAARLAGLPVLWHVRDRIADDYLPGRVAKVFRLLCKYVPTRVLTNSAATVATLMPADQIEGNAGHYIVVHDGTTLPPFGSGDAATGGRIHTNPVIGLVGRISPWKGQHIFLRAAAEVLKQYPHAHFQIIGAALFAEQDYDRQLHDLVKQLGIESNVEFTGFQSNVLEWISRLDLLVHASTTGEPFGQVVIEAMAAEKPVVATRGGGIPEIVLDGVTGLLVPMNEAPAMSHAILQILSDPTAAAKMGAAGRQRVVDHFTIERTARQVQDIYDLIVPVPRTAPAGGLAVDASARASSSLPG
jgi:glycosyltransferase involved in cell wall biosynthesis